MIPRIAVALAIGMTGTGHAQDFPSRPIRIITSGVGGGGDFAARQIAQGVAGSLGQQIIVDNRGSGIRPMETAAKALPDGYSVLVSGTSLWLAPLTRNVPYDPIRDFAPVTTIGTTPYLLFVHPSMSVKSVKDLIALARAKPGALNGSVGGLGGGNHLALELFKSMAAVNIVAVPYASGSQELQDLLAGRVEMTFTNPIALMDQVKSGKVRALAVASLQPSTLAPGVPTFAASGLPGYEWAQSIVMMAPGQTPPAIVHRLNQEVSRFLRTPKATEVFLASGVETVGGAAAQLADMIRNETARIGKLIKDAGIKAD